MKTYELRTRGEEAGSAVVVPPATHATAFAKELSCASYCAGDTEPVLYEDSMAEDTGDGIDSGERDAARMDAAASMAGGETCKGAEYVELHGESDVTRATGPTEGGACSFEGSAWSAPFECATNHNGTNVAMARFSVPGSTHFCVMADFNWVSGGIGKGALARAVGVTSRGMISTRIGVADRTDGRYYGTFGDNDEYKSPAAGDGYRVVLGYKRVGDLYGLAVEMRSLTDVRVLGAGTFASSMLGTAGGTHVFGGIELGLADEVIIATPPGRIRFSNIRVFKKL